jgi:hypothetical protein
MNTKFGTLLFKKSATHESPRFSLEADFVGHFFMKPPAHATSES